jgi:2-dehydropantoate 2-reductase
VKVAVFGAGAIGGHIAARLVHGGADVSVVARGPHLAAMRARGIRVVAPDWDATLPVRAGEDPATFGVQDAVLVTVKAPALPAVARGIAPLLGPETAVVFVMNGIPWWYFHGHGGPWEGRRVPLADPGGAVWEAVGPARAIGGVVYSACTVVEPGVVQVAHRRSRLILGEPDGAMSARLAAIATALRAGGLLVDESPRIRDAVWAKLMGNLSGGPVAVLGGAAPKDSYGEPAIERAVRACYAEGMAVAAAMGHPVAVDVDAQIAHGREMSHRPSILQDLELGRPMEIDGIFGTTLDLARLAGVETPVLDRLVALVRVRARMAGLY